MDPVLLRNSLLAAETAEPHLGWGIIAYVAIVWAVIFSFVYFARKGFHETIFRTVPAQWAEQAFVFVEGICVNVIGEHGRKYVPMILTIWMVIFTSNMVGLILPHTPSADWSLNLGLALVVVGYVQWEGMRTHFDHEVAHGTNPVVAVPISFFKHLLHFSGPRLAWYLIPISMLLFFIEVLSEMLRILTLSIRLYGNIHGGHQVRSALDHMVTPIAVGGGAVTVPLGIFILPLEFLVAILQAMVFTILSCVYLAIVTAHHDDEETAHEPATAGHGHETTPTVVAA